MAVILIAFLSSLVFGLGLILSSMADPAKVLVFLDLAGAWNPSLALVMGGALAVGLSAFAVARRCKASLRGEPLRLPTARRIDAQLLGRQPAVRHRLGVGGLLSGAGAGGPGHGAIEGVVFVLAMLAGMGLFELAERLRTARRPHAA